MEAVVLNAAEPKRWTIVFHRKAENWFFSAIAMGRFKHVSAFAWVPEARVWLVYDLGFCRTRIVAMPDSVDTRAQLAHLITGNAIVSMQVRTNARPVFRLGLFCTTAVKHLIGLTGSALRPDALFASCLRAGGELSDDGSQEDRTAGGSKPASRAAAGAAIADHAAAEPG